MNKRKQKDKCARSGVIPYRSTPEGIRFLLITSIRRGRWIIPKGQLEPDMTSAESAAQEAFEEAGVLGKMFEPSLGTYTYTRRGDVHTVETFVMEVTHELEHWPEQDKRKREWLSLEEAIGRVEEEGLKALFQQCSKGLFEV